MDINLEIRPVNKTHKSLFGNTTILSTPIRDVSYVSLNIVLRN